MNQNTDRLYSAPLNRIGDFEFDDSVADVFPDMIRRSVPGYGSMLSMIAQTAERFSQPNTHLYDLGCSLGAGTMLLRQHAAADCRVIAVDNSTAMTSRLKQLVAGAEATPVDVVTSDLCEVGVSNASVVVLNLTLQFLPPEDRTEQICRIVDGMRNRGALLLSEKICFEDPVQQQLMTEMHHDFKKAHGYSDLEIAQKRTAIENALIPETLDTHIRRLKSAGMSSVVPWFQCFNFASILAVK